MFLILRLLWMQLKSLEAQVHPVFLNHLLDLLNLRKPPKILRISWFQRWTMRIASRHLEVNLKQIVPSNMALRI